MRDYGTVSPKFWTQGTGKALRGNPEAQIVALYLMTSPHSNMIGVFHLPLLYIAHETGLTMEGASKGLQRGIDSGFCQYDAETETVFVIEMAHYQIGETLKAKDLRAKSIYKLYAAIEGSRLGDAFFDRYGDDFSLPSKPLASPLEGALKDSEGASKPHYPVTASDTAKKKKAKSAAVTLPDWIAALDGADTVPADDSIFGWAKSAGVPAEWIGLAWWAFENRYGPEGKDKSKTYTDWRAVFRTAVKEDWLRLWRKGREGWELTTAGENVRCEMGAAQ